MNRYIEADALTIGIKENNLGEWYVGRIDGKAEEVIPTDTVYKIIDSAPSIDIVRCKACRWGKPYSEKQLECDALGLGGLKFPDEFCSHGERREP